MSPTPDPCWPLRTARLTIDRLTALDAPTLAAYRCDPVVARFQSWPLPYPVADAETLVAAAAGAPFGTPGHASQLAVRYHDPGHGRDDDAHIGDVHIGDVHIGDVHIGDVHIQVLADTPHAAEIGVTIAADHHGRGLASEAVSAVVDVLVGPVVHKAIAFVDARNDASLALFDRLGFRREGLLADSFRRPDGTFADEVLFGLTVPQLAAHRAQRRDAQPRAAQRPDAQPRAAQPRAVRPAAQLADRRGRQGGHP